MVVVKVLAEDRKIHVDHIYICDGCTQILLARGASVYHDSSFKTFWHDKNVLLHFHCFAVHTLALCVYIHTYRIASNYGWSRINSWSHLVAGGIKHHNKNKCWVSNKRLVQSLF